MTERSLGFCDTRALRNRQADAAVARQIAGAGQDQVAHAGESHESFSARTERDAQSSHFGKTTRDQRRTRIETQTEAVADACCNGNDVLHRPADFGTNDVIMRIHAQRRAVQRLRRRRSKRGVL